MKKIEENNYIVYQGKVNAKGWFEKVKIIGSFNLKSEAMKVFNKVKKKKLAKVDRNHGEYVETSIYSNKDCCYIKSFVN